MHHLPPGSILLSGLPATGKSSFGSWLEAQQGYFHLDFDEEDIVTQRGFGDAQDQLWHYGNAMPLYSGMRHDILISRTAILLCSTANHTMWHFISTQAGRRYQRRTRLLVCQKRKLWQRKP